MVSGTGNGLMKTALIRSIQYLIAIVIINFATISSASSPATNQIVAQHVPNAREVGRAHMQVMLWDVYDAALFAPDGIWKAESPFALRLDYLRTLRGPRIVARSIDEMRKQGFSDEIKLNLWQQKMMQIIPDVHKGDTITGIRDHNGYSQFFMNDRPIGVIEDPDFTRQFFGIWLDRKTSEPDMRHKLLGQQD